MTTVRPAAVPLKITVWVPETALSAALRTETAIIRGCTEWIAPVTPRWACSSSWATAGDATGPGAPCSRGGSRVNRDVAVLSATYGHAGEAKGRVVA